MKRQKIETIIANLKECFDGTPWYGISVMEKLNQISWEVTNEKIYGSKTIAVLVQHIINWRIFVLKKLEDDYEYDIVLGGENDWEEVFVSNNEQWQVLLQELRETQVDLLTKLSGETDALLLKQVPGKNYTFEPMLTSIAQHDIYHLGQIAMLNAIRAH